MASSSCELHDYKLDRLHCIVFQPDSAPKLDCPIPFVQVEVTITLQLHSLHHYCACRIYFEVDILLSQETLRFNLHLLNDRDRACQILEQMLARLGIIPNFLIYNTVIDTIIRYGLEIGNMDSDRTRKVLPLHAVIWGVLLKHVNSVRVLIERALEESALELERSNYGMVPAKESSVKKMLKMVRVKGGDCEKGEESIKKRQPGSGENCVICLEELKVGSKASQIPCSHTFHGKCIEKRLKQSHYCPVCRFEMPTSETDEELSFSHSS